MELERRKRKWFYYLILTVLLIGVVIPIKTTNAKERTIELYGTPTDGDLIINCPVLTIEEYSCSKPPNEIEGGLVANWKKVEFNGKWKLVSFDPTTGRIAYELKTELLGLNLNYAKCVYVNPFCTKDLENQIEKLKDFFTFSSVLKHITLSKLLIESATMGTDVFYYSFKDKELRVNELSIFVVLFNQLTPLFENLALFLFELGFLVYAIIFGWNRLSEKLAGYEYPYKQNFLSSFLKGGLIFVLFGLPINPPDVPKDLKYQPAPIPLVLYVFKYPILMADEMMTDIGGNMVKFVGDYLLDKHIDFSKKLLELEYKFHSSLITKYNKLQEELKTTCIQPYNNCGNSITVEDYKTFLVRDEDLDDLDFCDAGGNSLPNKMRIAKECRYLAQVFEGVKSAIEVLPNQEKITNEVINNLKNKEKKLKPKIEKFSDNLKEELGSLSSGVGLPIVYIYVKQQVYDEISQIQEISKLYSIDIQKASDKNKEVNGLVKWILVPTLIVSIPPFSDLFNIIRMLLDNIEEGATNIMTALMIGGFLSGNLGFSLLGVIIFLALKVLSGFKTVIAVAITYFLANTILPYLFYLSIAFAVVLRFGNFIWDIVKYVWTLPFMVYSLLLTRSEEIIIDFLKHIITYTLLLVLIVISPLVGLFIFELFNLLINYTFYTTFTNLQMFDLDGLLGVILINIFFAITYILAMLIGTFMGIKATYQFPDMVLSQLKTSIQAISKISHEAFQSISAKFTPKI
jgi:hypothetical protein